jgi:hypothetical protein
VKLVVIELFQMKEYLFNIWNANTGHSPAELSDTSHPAEDLRQEVDARAAS